MLYSTRLLYMHNADLPKQNNVSLLCSIPEEMNVICRKINTSNFICFIIHHIVGKDTIKMSNMS